MALSPNEVDHLVRIGMCSDNQKADELESLVDTQLPMIYRRGRVIRPQFPHFVSRVVIEELGRRYSRAGWHVDIEEPRPGSPGFKLDLTARRDRVPSKEKQEVFIDVDNSLSSEKLVEFLEKLGNELATVRRGNFRFTQR